MHLLWYETERIMLVHVALLKEEIACGPRAFIFAQLLQKGNIKLLRSSMWYCVQTMDHLLHIAVYIG